MLLAAGSIKKDDLIRSLFAYKTLIGLTAEFGTEFLEKPLGEIFAELDRRIQPTIDSYVTTQLIQTT